LLLLFVITSIFVLFYYAFLLLAEIVMHIVLQFRRLLCLERVKILDH